MTKYFLVETEEDKKALGKYFENADEVCSWSNTSDNSIKFKDRIYGCGYNYILRVKYSNKAGARTGWEKTRNCIDIKGYNHWYELKTKDYYNSTYTKDLEDEN